MDLFASAGLDPPRPGKDAACARKPLRTLRTPLFAYKVVEEARARVETLSNEIANAEREIDAIVYRLFDLTEDDIALLEASIAGQY